MPDRPTIVLSMLDEFRDRFFDAAAIERLREAGELVLDPDPVSHATPESRAALGRAEVLITGWGVGSIDEHLASGGLPHLGLLAHSGGSVRGITGPQIFDHGVRVSSQTQLNSEPVAEFTLAMIILAAKNVFSAQNDYRRLGEKPDFTGPAYRSAGLYGATIGIIGLSRISRRVIELLRAFHCTILVDSGHLSDADATALGVRRASRHEVLSTSDVVSLHSASTPRTRHMLGRDDFAAMKDDATFINTARGAICDEAALLAELRTGRINAVIDVTDPEVPVPDSSWWELPNVQLFPHYAGSMGRELYRLGDGTVADIESFLAGQAVAGEFERDEYDGRA